MHAWVNLSWEYPHNSICCHVECDPDTGLELVLVDLGSAADDVARPARSLDHDLVLGDLLEDLSDQLTDTFDVLEVVLSLVESLPLFIDLNLHVLNSLLHVRVLLLTLDVCTNQGVSVSHFLSI